MGDYLIDLFFEPVPKDVRGKYKLLVYLIRVSEALILIGLALPWYHSRAFGATFSGVATDSGKLILLILVASNILSWWRPLRVPMSRYAWGMALVGVVTFLLTYGETGGDPDDRFVLESGLYVTMAGGVLRFVLGGFLGHQLEQYEKVMAMLGLRDATLATPGAVEKDPAP
jgi:hypothetical protein